MKYQKETQEKENEKGTDGKRQQMNERPGIETIKEEEETGRGGKGRKYIGRNWEHMKAEMEGKKEGMKRKEEKGKRIKARKA